MTCKVIDKFHYLIPLSISLKPRIFLSNQMEKRARNPRIKADCMVGVEARLSTASIRIQWAIACLGAPRCR